MVALTSTWFLFGFITKYSVHLASSDIPFLYTNEISWQRKWDCPPLAMQRPCSMTSNILGAMTTLTRFSSWIALQNLQPLESTIRIGIFYASGVFMRAPLVLTKYSELLPESWNILNTWRYDRFPGIHTSYRWYPAKRALPAMLQYGRECYQCCDAYIKICTSFWNMKYIEGILPRGSYLPCVSMVGRALLAGYPRFGE